MTWNDLSRGQHPEMINFTSITNICPKWYDFISISLSWRKYKGFFYQLTYLQSAALWMRGGFWFVWIGSQADDSDIFRLVSASYACYPQHGAELSQSRFPWIKRKLAPFTLERFRWHGRRRRCRALLSVGRCCYELILFRQWPWKLKFRPGLTMTLTFALLGGGVWTPPPAVYRG